MPMTRASVTARAAAEQDHEGPGEEEGREHVEQGREAEEEGEAPTVPTASR